MKIMPDLWFAGHLVLPDRISGRAGALVLPDLWSYQISDPAGPLVLLDLWALPELWALPDLVPCWTFGLAGPLVLPDL